MAETWYFRSGTGASCGPGTQRPLQTTQGSATATQDLASEHTWNRVETARQIGAGTWEVRAWVTTGGGGGPAARVTIVVERRNSSCVVQETLLNSQSANLTSGATQEVVMQFTPGAITFAADDVLTVRLLRTQGSRSLTARFNNSTDNANSLLSTPDEASTPAGGTGGLVSGLGALGATITGTHIAPAVGDLVSALAALSAGASASYIAPASASLAATLGALQSAGGAHYSADAGPIGGLTSGLAALSAALAGDYQPASQAGGLVSTLAALASSGLGSTGAGGEPPGVPIVQHPLHISIQIGI